MLYINKAKTLKIVSFKSTGKAAKALHAEAWGLSQAHVTLPLIKFVRPGSAHPTTDLPTF
jgi:hypothetical protein